MGVLSIIGSLRLNASSFHQTLKGAEAASKNFANNLGSSLKGAVGGAIGIGTITALAKETIEYGDSIDELAERLGVASSKAQLYTIAAKLGGSTTEFFASKFEKLRKAMAEGKSLEIFGVKAATAEEAIDQLAEKIQKTGLNTEQANKFVEIFGKGSGKMINILGDLKSAGQGTLLFSDQDINRLKQADDIITKMGNNLKVAFAFFADKVSKGQGLPGPFALVMSRFTKNAASGPTSARPDEEGFEDAEARAEEARKVHMATQDRILKLEKETAETVEQSRRAQLTPEERLNELYAEREELVKRLQFQLTEEGLAGNQLAIAKANQEIGRLLLSPSKESKADTINRSPLSDSLKSVGNFLGSDPSRGVLSELGDIKKELISIKQNTAKQSGGINFPS